MREVLQLPMADWLSLLVPGVLALALATGDNAWRLLLRYEREAIALGTESWRLLSAHVVHMNGAHLLLDGVALLLIWLLFVGTLPARGWWAAFLSGCLAIDFGLYYWQPQIDWYVGLSGVEHALFAAGALWLALARHAGAPWMLSGLVSKLAWEFLVGPMPWSTSASQGPVIEVAHLYGAAGGSIGFALWLACDESCRARLSAQRQGQ